MAQKWKSIDAEELAFLSVIHEQPRDDAPRLIFADWLEEHGKPERAEFIRLQIQHGEWNPTRFQQTERERDLEKEYGWQWAKDYRCGLEPFRFYRGLPLPTLYLSRCSSARLTKLLDRMNPSYRIMLMLEQRRLLQQGETDAVINHPFMARVAVLRLIHDDRLGPLDALLRRLDSLPLPVTVERLSLYRMQGEPRALAERLFGERYIVED